MRKSSAIIIVSIILACLACCSTSFAQSFVPWDAYEDAYYQVPSDGGWYQGYRIEYHHTEVGPNGDQDSRSYSYSRSGQSSKQFEHREHIGQDIGGESYEKLSANAQELYEKLYETMEYGSEISADSLSRVGYDTLDRVFVALLEDHPEFRKYMDVSDNIYNDDVDIDDEACDDEVDEDIQPYAVIDESDLEESVPEHAKAVTDFKVDSFSFPAQQEKPVQNYGIDNSSVPKVYSLLTNTEKGIYDEIYSVVSTAESSVTIDGLHDASTIRPAIEAMIQDHPEFVWLEVDYRYTNYLTANQTKIDFNYNNFASDPSKYQKEFESAASELVEKAKTLNTPEEMEKFFFEQIKLNTKYVSSDYDQTAYAALVWHQSVCTGAAMAMKYLLNQVGIPSFVVTSESHAWNMVKINGRWHYTDPTPYDTEKSRQNAIKNQNIDKRFNLSSSEFPYTPQWDDFPNDRLPKVP